MLGRFRGRALTTPDASVVIAAWNAEATLARAVDSALAQTATVEIVIVDDGSQDGTAALAEALATRHPNVAALRSPGNAGPGAARNRAIRASRAPWIAPLDADDFMERGRIEAMIAAARRVEADLLADDLLLVDEDDPAGARRRLIGGRDFGAFDVDIAAFVEGNLAARRGGRAELGFLKPIMRRDFLDAHGLRYGDMRLGEDYALYLQALAAGAKFTVVDPQGYVAVRRRGSLSHAHGATEHAALVAFDRKLLAGGGLDGPARRAVRAHMREHEEKQAWRLLIDAVRERRPLAALGCFVGPPSVVVGVLGRLFREAIRRAIRR